MRDDEEWSVSVVMDSTMLVTSDEYQRKIGDRLFQVENIPLLHDHIQLKSYHNH